MPPSLVLLQRGLEGLHVGGKSALDWHGKVLSEVGVRQPMQEARELVESSYSLRAAVLRDLLKRCTSIKTVRLCLLLGRELSQPWVGKLDPARLPTGSDRPWVSRSSEGLLVLEP